MIWRSVSDVFSKTENWGDPSKIDGFLLMFLYNLRKYVGVPFVIHCAYEKSGHVENSYHGLGMAVDGHFSGIPFKMAIGSVEYFVKSMQLDDRLGIGLYPDWNTPGFHFDSREKRARWGRIGGLYVSYDKARERAFV